MSEKASESLPVFAPVHLRSSEEIAATFGVRLDTVRHWRLEGAPIVLVGKRFQASYFDLWEWLKQRKKIDSEEENG